MLNNPHNMCNLQITCSQSTIEMLNHLWCGGILKHCWQLGSLYEFVWQAEVLGPNV